MFNYIKKIYDSLLLFIQYLVTHKSFAIALYRLSANNATPEKLPFTKASFTIKNKERMEYENKNDTFTVYGYCMKRLSLCMKYPFIHYDCMHEIEYDDDIFVRGVWCKHEIVREIVKSISDGVDSDNIDYHNAKIHFLMNDEILGDLFNN